LTFLAGAEVEPDSLRRHLKPTLVIGSVSFGVPFVGAWLFAQYIAGWELHEALIAGIALSTTSVAVVYAVMIETGLNRTEVGKMILAACFVTDFGTVLALGALFANFNGLLVLFVAVLAVSLFFMPRWTRFIIRSAGNRVSEPEIKFIFFMLFLLGGFATAANSEAVLPAYLVGLVIAGVFVRDKVLVNRMRSIAFALLTPFYFLKAGLYVSLPAVASGAGLIVALLLVKLASKALVVWPTARIFRFTPRESSYTTLLMSTGLTFGTISALFGLSNGIINRTQYTILVTVVILSAVVPTLIAQTFFRPEIPLASEEEVGEGLEEPVPTRPAARSPAAVD
jgi:Kef-type K+ transport system membrane component KefB